MARVVPHRFVPKHRHRSVERAQLKQVRPKISLGLGVIDIKVNQVETPDEVARCIEKAEKKLGESRIGWIHPDCGFWMLHRSVTERKIAALVQVRDLYLGR